MIFLSFGALRMSADGGKPAPAIVLDKERGETASSFPAFLQDGKRFLVRIERDDASAIHLASIDAPERRMILDDVLSAPLFAPTPQGDTYLLYMRDDELVAHEFDERAATVRGSPRVLVKGIGRVANPPVMPALGVSPGGVIAYQMGGDFTSMVLNWVSRSGTPLGEVTLDVTGQNPMLSPDGRLLAIDASSRGDRDVWVADVTRGVTSRVTSGGGTDRSPVWSPDGKRIAFSRGKQIFVTSADGSTMESLLADVEGLPRSWSPDGRYLLYQTPKRTLSLWPFAGGTPIAIGPATGSSTLGQFSPDSRAIAYTSNESGAEEVYVRLTPPATGRIRVSANGGSRPRWGRTSHELFFLAPDRTMMAVDLRVGEALSADLPKKIFALEPSSVFSNMRFDVDVNSQRFLVPRLRGETSSDTPITVVLNWWVDLLKRPR